MAFTPETFVVCSKFPLFRATSNLWLYVTSDSLEDCLAEHYFQPRLNLKNQDSPEVGDVIQCIVEGSKLAYLKIVGKTEKPYYITVARTFLENEAEIIAEISELANKTTDFATPITDENLGITQAEQSELEDKIDLAANSGRMITAQGFWYAKMHSETVAPSAEDGTNYADFSQVDGQGNPIIVTYNRVSGVWVQDQTITPPADYDGYVAITSKIWDIAEQDGQQGGRVLWNHVSKEFTPYPQIIAFDSVELTGDSTVVMPANPDDDNIANVGFVLEHCAARNVGDIFYTSRTDSVLNGAVPCDGTSYHTTDFSGSQAPGALLQAGKLPYVPLATYAALLAQNGSVGVFGWDGLNTTEFKVPTLTDIFIETGTSAQVGDYIEPSIPNLSGKVTLTDESSGLLDYHYLKAFADASGVFSVEEDPNKTNASPLLDSTGSSAHPNYLKVDASSVSSVYKNNATTVQPNTVRYRAMIQLSTGASDQSLGMLAQVAYTGDYDDLLNKPTIPTAVSQLTNDSGYIDSIKTINNNSLVGSGNLELSTYLPFGNWPTTGTTKLFCDAIAADASAVKGKAYLGEVTFSDLPSSMANGEAVVEIMDGTTAANKVIVLTLNSGNVAPYMWRYTYWNQGNNVSGWVSWATTSQIPTVNNSTITITQGGITKGTFTTNQASASTIELDAGGGGSDIPQSIDAELVGGTPAQNIDGTDFKSNGTTYLVFPGTLNMAAKDALDNLLYKSFEIGMAFTTPLLGYGGVLLSTNSVYYPHLEIKINSSYHVCFDVYNDNSGTPAQSVEGSTALSGGTKYYVKIIKDWPGNNYTILLSTDGTNYTTDATASVTALPGVHHHPYRMGYGGSSGGLTLHMAECYVEKNNMLYWSGVGAAGLHQRAGDLHYVIESSVPTAGNNYTWYRKYADGWVEQGGNNGVNGTDIALPVTMADTNYNTPMPGILSYASTTGIGADALVVVKTTTTVKYGTFTGFGLTFSWKIEGMAA